jgi:hypothetical protein
MAVHDDSSGRIDAEYIHLLGVEQSTGRPLVEPLLSVNEAADHLQRYEEIPRRIAQLGRFAEQRPLGLAVDIDPADLSQTGWAVVIAEDTPKQVIEALKPLMKHRAECLGSRVYHELSYPRNQSPEEWIAENSYPGQIDPVKLPYYILLVGGPETIPFELQYQLDVEYAVGRLSFDTPDEYRRYADGVVFYETNRSPVNAREVVYWAPRIPGDRATDMSERLLIGSLCDGIPASGGLKALDAPAKRSKYQTSPLRGPEATKRNIMQVLHRRCPDLPPALLVAASHGLAIPRGDHQQRQYQGALLCQDWSYGRPVQRGDHLSAADLDDAWIRGLVTFFFACYGAGTPAADDFPLVGRPHVDCSAERPFIAALPRRLLSHPNGPALAVISHVERAWSFSIQPKSDPQIGPFRNLIYRILEGERIGHAAKEFGEKYSLLSVRLVDQRARLASLPDAARAVASRDMVPLWIDRTDFRNYILLGDPAARLRAELMIDTPRDVPADPTS